jgi:hypothetical protein
MLNNYIKRKLNGVVCLCRNRFLQRVIEGKIRVERELAGRRGRGRWQLLAELKESECTSHLQ